MNSRHIQNTRSTQYTASGLPIRRVGPVSETVVDAGELWQWGPLTQDALDQKAAAVPDQFAMAFVRQIMSRHRVRAVDGELICQAIGLPCHYCGDCQLINALLNVPLSVANEVNGQRAHIRGRSSQEPRAGDSVGQRFCPTVRPRSIPAGGRAGRASAVDDVPSLAAYDQPRQSVSS